MIFFNFLDNCIKDWVHTVAHKVLKIFSSPTSKKLLKLISEKAINLKTVFNGKLQNLFN